jgi:hypothetical protein
MVDTIENRHYLHSLGLCNITLFPSTIPEGSQVDVCDRCGGPVWILLQQAAYIGLVMDTGSTPDIMCVPCAGTLQFRYGSKVHLGVLEGKNVNEYEVIVTARLTIAGEDLTIDGAARIAADKMRHASGPDTTVTDIWVHRRSPLEDMEVTEKELEAENGPVTPEELRQVREEWKPTTDP